MKITTTASPQSLLNKNSGSVPPFDGLNIASNRDISLFNAFFGKENRSIPESTKTTELEKLLDMVPARNLVHPNWEKSYGDAGIRVAGLVKDQLISNKNGDNKQHFLLPDQTLQNANKGDKKAIGKVMHQWLSLNTSY